MTRTYRNRAASGAAAAAMLAALAMLGACGRDDNGQTAAPETETDEVAAPDPATGETGGAPADVADQAGQQSEAEPAAPNTRTAERPLTLDLGSEYADISVTLPEEAAGDPVLYDALRKQAESEAEEARKVADDDYKSRTSQDFPFHKHELTITWDAAFANDDVLSLLKTSFVFEGGAHPNTYFDAKNWRLDTHKDFTIEDVIDGQAGYEALSQAAEDAIMAEKKKRLGDGLSDADYSRDEVRKATAPAPANFELFTLVPSKGDASKAGGVALHFAPYAFGPYVEGDYHVAIPQSAFAGHVTQDYAPLFAGEPEAVPEHAR